MRTPKYDSNNPRKLISIRIQTLNEINNLYPNENTTQKQITKLIKEVKKCRTEQDTSNH